MMSDSQAMSGRAALSAEQVRILQLLAAERTTVEVARELHISERTLRRRTHQICVVLGVETHMQAVVWAVRQGVV